MFSFAAHIRHRIIKQNKNYLCTFVGATGSGKSYSALRLAQEVDPDFSIANVVFTPAEFLEILKAGTLKRGSVILFDEAGVAANSRNFQSATNKVLHFVNQTFRSKNYCVIYTCPDFNFLDIGIRKLLHALFETKRIDYEKELCYVKPLLIENNPQSGKIYMKYPRYRNPEGRRKIVVITMLAFRKPSPEMIMAYEDRKFRFNREFIIKADKTLSDINAPPAKVKEKVDIPAIVAKVKADPARYITKSGAVKEGLLRIDFGLTTYMARQINQLARE